MTKAKRGKGSRPRARKWAKPTSSAAQQASNAAKRSGIKLETRVSVLEVSLESLLEELREMMQGPEAPIYEEE